MNVLDADETIAVLVLNGKKKVQIVYKKKQKQTKRLPQFFIRRKLLFYFRI